MSSLSYMCEVRMGDSSRVIWAGIYESHSLAAHLGDLKE